MTGVSQPVIDVIRSFGLLGVTAFGGPTAHLGYFREEFVSRRRWLSERSYADIVAVAQFLPGPASSQVGMALGYHRAGWMGMLAAWVMFTAPSAILLAAFGLLMNALGIDADQGWIKGLLAAAVAVVFHAVSGMAKTMANTKVTATIAVLAGLIVLAVPSPFTHIAVIIAAGVLGVVALRDSLADAADEDPEPEPIRAVSARAATISLVAFFVLLGGLALAATTVGGYLLTRLAAYFQAGSLVFGGGHVVLPLLQAEVVPPGWLDDQTFIAGYGAAQAVPGPLFTFAAYLGAAMRPGVAGVATGLLALAAVFLPSFLLLIGVLPFWDRLRAQASVQAALRGVNAAVVGLLLAALYEPVWTSAVRGAPDLALGLAAFLLLAVWRWPAWAVVLLSAVVGAFALG